MGVVLFMLLILPTMSTSRMKLSKFEISSLSKDNFRFRAHQTVRVISTVYVGLTVTEIILLMLAGMDMFDATCHSFGTIATGGFSTRNLSVAAFDSVWIDISRTSFFFSQISNYQILCNCYYYWWFAC
jgi:trk system potassium uptake protein TrkH